jgi:cytochrome c peroxidase
MSAAVAGMALMLSLCPAVAGDVAAPPPDAAALGEGLFSDPRLSPDGRFSCASCHRPDAAFAEPGVARQHGRDGAPLAVNTPSLIDLDRRGPFRHDGAAGTLEQQVAVPLLAKNEMANPSLAAVADRLAAEPGTAADFVRVYGRPPVGGDVVSALAAYVRSLQFEDTPFDDWWRGDTAALSPAALRGLALFRGEAGCAACHLVDGVRPGFRDGRFHDTGIVARSARRPYPGGVPPSAGRMAVTGRHADRFRVRTPGLRGVAATPPYMHDGSIRSLEAVIRYYAAGGAAHDGLSPLIAPFMVDDGDVADLVAFLEALGPAAPSPAAVTAVSGAPAE